MPMLGKIIYGTRLVSGFRITIIYVQLLYCVYRIAGMFRWEESFVDFVG